MDRHAEKVVGDDGNVRNDLRRALAKRGDLPLPRQRLVASGSAPDFAELVELAAARSAGAVSVIVPTRNESGNVRPLLNRLGHALRGLEAQVIFVDDSDDDTPREITAAARLSAMPVYLHHRTGAARVGGLGGAVVDGLRLVDSPWAVVMDGDLQHPPELLPGLVEIAEQRGADVVVASRHVVGGSSDGLANVTRVVVSGLSTRITKFVFPHRLGGITDPMSGYFLIRPAAFDLDTLRPNGFKILLELLVRTKGLRKQEVPFVFGERHAGESKASLKEGLRFLGQLLRLVGGRLRPAAMRLPEPGVLARGASFGAVGVTGIFVNSLLLWLLASPGGLGLNYLLAAVLATQGSSTWNFALVDSVVYRGPKRLTRLRRWLGFLGLSNAVLLLRIPLLALLVSAVGVHYLIANAFTLLFGFLLRFSGQERLTLAKDAS